VVRRIFRMYYKDGLSQRKIADSLNAEGVATKADHASPTSVDGTKKGWWRGQVSRILTNRVYVGEAYYNKTEANPDAGKRKGVLYRKRRPKDEPNAWIPIDCPTIVSEEEFIAAAERAKRNARWGKLPADRKTEYLLSGLLRCHCGRVLYGKTIRKTVKGKTYRYRYYECAGQGSYGSPCRPKQRISARLIEDPVWSSVVDAFRDPRRVLVACVAHADQLLAEQDSEEGRAEDVKRKLAQADEERDRLVALCAKGTITEGQLKRQLARLDAEVVELEEALGRVEEGKRQKQHVDDIERVARTIAGRIEQISEAMTLEERKALLRALVERIVVAEDNALTIECAVPGILQEPQATTEGARSTSDAHKAPQATCSVLRLVRVDDFASGRERHHVVRPVLDQRGAGVTEELLDQHLLGETHSTVQLQRVARHLERSVRAEDLRSL
ncbi:MAG: recombinase family protein, partial [Chloroflexi bacterium]|nr:recombinase family protein [Chloroflexota bacterium]